MDDAPLAVAGANLPVALTSFVGRDRELAEVRRLLGETRLLTLTGAGGVGKTRLALEAARALAGDYADGVWWVDLAPLADPGLVPQALADGLGVRERAGRPVLDALLAAVAGRRALVVVDNCEHLVEACARALDALLRGCPGLRALATGREPLRVAGEVPFRLPSLALPAAPGPAGGPRAEEVGRAEAAALFVARAAAAAPGWALTDANAAVVAEVCRRLDGVPLALELAAARVTALTVEQLAARLDDRFRLLTGGSRTALPRQQTLHATMDWSHDLLDGPERVLLRRLSVFAGGFTLEAAEHVGAGDGLAAADVLDTLARLVDQSLAQAEPRRGEMRYRLLETVRQYAAAKLAESGEAASARDRHRDWCLALAERAEPALWGEEAVAWLERLEADHDNLRAALDWSLGAPAGAEAGLRLAGALSLFWRIHGHASEGLRWAEALLAAGDAAPAARAKALTTAGFQANQLDDHGRADAHLRQALAHYRCLGDRRGTAYVLHVLGRVAYTRGDHDGAAALLGEGLALARQLGDARISADTLYELGRAGLRRGDDARAEAWLRESLALFREEGAVVRIVSVLTFLGVALAGRGEPGRAAALLEESLALARAQGFRRGVAQALHWLGRLAQRRGEAAPAAALLRESLALRRDLHDREGIAECLEALGMAARGPRPAARDAAPGERFAVPARAARLLGAAEALRAAIGAPLPPVERPGHEAAVRATRAALGAPAFASAWAAGRALSAEGAVAEALAPEAPEAAAGAEPPPAGPPSPLSAREAEVAALIRDGLTSRQIAAALAISERTVERHVSAIMNKLGLASRAQIAAWLAERRARAAAASRA